MKVLKKAILPRGFKAQGVAAGIKKSGRQDLALFFSDLPAKAAARFTTNRIQAAPLKVTEMHLTQTRTFRALIVNSGNANCFTGAGGLDDAEETTRFVASSLGITKESVLVCSTGVIGKRLPLKKLQKAIPVLISGLSSEGIEEAKKAILTTDTFSKELTAQCMIGRQRVTLCGIAKGAGMIAPNMATMLCFIFTDAHITQRALDQALRICVDNSFHCITVDGCMSTNDTVMILANAAAGNLVIDTRKNFKVFLAALNTVCLGLAKLIVKDAEGATKFIRIDVHGARTSREAKKAALSIANSNLFKAAMFGSSKNIIGRIVASIGASAIEAKEEKLEIKYSPLHKEEVAIKVLLHSGRASATVYTSDLTPAYVRINAAYN